MQRHRQQHGTRLRETRLRVAQEAARLMVGDSIQSPEHARRKAAARLGVHDHGALPDLHEIEAALREHQRLYASTDAAALRHRRQAALRAMDFLSPFEPRLTGAVLEGTADTHSSILLHLHADDVESVGLFLEGQGIPAELRQRRIQLDPSRSLDAPVWKFVAEDLVFELLVLPLNALRQPPLAKLDRRPVRRASSRQLAALMAEDDPPGDKTM